MQQTLGSFFLESSSRTKTIFLEFVLKIWIEEDADAVIGNDLYLPLNMLQTYRQNSISTK
jgi:hypothetical protein